MDSRSLLNQLEKLGVLIDSKSFEELLDNNNRIAHALLTYFQQDCVTFVRTPFSSKYTELTKIPEYKLIINPQNRDSLVCPSSPHSFNSVQYVKNSKPCSEIFCYRCRDIESTAKEILKKTTLTEDELNLFYSVSIQATFNRSPSRGSPRNEVFIFITQNNVLLKNRLWFESDFQVQLNIMSIDEASIFLDLFFKKIKKYLARGNYIINKGRWYEFSLRSKIPYLNAGDPIIATLTYRMKYALMALDEMGFQYYQGVNNDRLDDTLYHFNYLIPLITGIFDNLALKTNDRLGINFSDKQRQQISLKNKDFLKQIDEKDHALRMLIEKNVDLINLIYLFRNSVVHREWPERLHFSKAGQWEANVVKISKEIIDEIRLCGDKKSKYDDISKWGIYTVDNDSLLEPYHFSFEVLKMLVLFIDEYLELLHYTSFIEQQNRIDDDFSLMKVFEKYHLGF
jgi:hypothetical protein